MTTFENIKNISKKRGYSLQDTAEKAGLSKNAIYNWKTKAPSLSNITKVANALNVSVDYLLGNEEEKAADIDDLSQIMRFQGREIPESQREIVLKILKELNDEHNNK